METPQGTDLTDTEARAVADVAAIDSGSVAERLAEKAVDVAYRADVTPTDLRELAALALALSRRTDASPAAD